MPNLIDANGIQVKSKADIVAELTAGYQTIYGADINTDPSTPDGQVINIQAQAIEDQLDLNVQVFNSMDPDLAVGRTLDQRCALNGVKRLGGTYSLIDIDVVTDRSCSLPGLDGDLESADGTGYTIQDNAGVKWILAATQNPAGAGTYTYQFRAQLVGATIATPNTITTPVTIVLGVVSVNNPAVVDTLGIDQETDAQLKIRRQKSVSIASSGYFAALRAALLNINAVTSAFVYENNTGATDGDGVPEHSIWVIVNGGTDTDIADVIYAKRSAGCGMKGSEIVPVTQADGTQFIIKFDRVVSENLYIQITLTTLGPGTIDQTYMKNQIVALLDPGVYEKVNINELSTIVQIIDPNVLVVPTVGDGFSLTAGSYTNTLLPSAKNRQFLLATARIALVVI